MAVFAVVENAAAVVEVAATGRIIGERAVGDRLGPAVENAAALVGAAPAADLAVGNRQAVERDRHAAADVEDAARLICINRQRARSRPLNRHTIIDRQLAQRERDGAVDAECDGRTTRIGVGEADCRT